MNALKTVALWGWMLIGGVWSLFRKDKSGL